MAKFYIQSGTVKVVVSAVDAEGAALFVLNQTINQLMPSGNLEELHADESSMMVIVQCLEILGNEFLVSEIGFGHSEVAIFDTEILFKRWCELLSAMNHLMDRLDEKGI